MKYSSEQVRGIQSLISKYASSPADNGATFRKAVLELKQLGLDPLSVALPGDLWTDEEEDDEGDE